MMKLNSDRALVAVRRRWRLPRQQNVQINGAGATFPYPIYSKWFSEYNKLHPNVADQLPVDRIGRRHPADHQRRPCSSAPPTAR